MLAADLVGYQDARYAATFLDAVAEAASAEQRVATGSGAASPRPWPAACTS